MAHNKIESEEPQQPEPRQDERPQQEPGPESGQEPGAPSSAAWEDPPRPPSPSGFNPDYWPKIDP